MRITDIKEFKGLDKVYALQVGDNVRRGEKPKVVQAVVGKVYRKYVELTFEDFPLLRLFNIEGNTKGETLSSLSCTGGYVFFTEESDICGYLEMRKLREKLSKVLSGYNTVSNFTDEQVIAILGIIGV